MNTSRRRNQERPQSNDHLLRVLGMAFALAIGIGTTIGGGILRTPGDIAALLRLDPIWDPLHRDPAFQALLKKYGGTGRRIRRRADPAPRRRENDESPCPA